jgi:hypothetical protein
MAHSLPDSKAPSVSDQQRVCGKRQKGHENVVFAPSMVSMKKTIQQRLEPLSGSLAKRVSQEKL